MHWVRCIKCKNKLFRVGTTFQGPVEIKCGSCSEIVLIKTESEKKIKARVSCLNG